MSERLAVAIIIVNIFLKKLQKESYMRDENRHYLQKANILSTEITGFWWPNVHSNVAFWYFDVIDVMIIAKQNTKTKYSVRFWMT